MSSALHDNKHAAFFTDFVETRCGSVPQKKNVILHIILHILLSLKVCYEHGGNADIWELIFFKCSEIYVNRNVSRVESMLESFGFSVQTNIRKSHF